MTPRQIAIQVKGAKRDHGDVRLEEFIEQMESIRSALRETERRITGDDPKLYFRIVDMRHTSPATMVLEAASETGNTASVTKVARVVIRHFTSNLRFLIQKQRVPKTADVPELETYREMIAPLDKNISELVVKTGKQSAVINLTFKQTLEKLLGPEETVYGSISGMIEAINVHNASKFTLYPSVGPRKVFGRFRQPLRDKFTKAVDKYVTIYGELRFKTWDKFPYGVIAEDIEIHDEEGIVSLGELRGMAPAMTGEMVATEFVDHIRNEDS